jgi:hypothetical protein
MNQDNTDIELAGLIQKNRKNLEHDFNNNFDIQTKTLSIIAGGLEHANFNNFDKASLVWNIAGYLNLISYDLKIIGRDLMFAQDGFQRRHYARQMYLLIYESMDDFFQLMGNPLKTAVREFGDAETHLNAVKSIATQLSKFKKEYGSKIKVVRHTAIAHRDKDFLSQRETINSIDWGDAIEILGKYDAIVRSLGQVLQQLMDRTTDELHEKQKPQ